MRRVCYRSTTDQPDRGAPEVEALVFARSWLPYGGADSYEIFTTFGLTPAQFGQRLRRAVDDSQVRSRLELSHDDQLLLLAEARRMESMAWPADVSRRVS